MFESLGDRLTTVFDRMTGRGVLSPADIDEALREVRLALLDADVALPAVKDFIAKARDLATGEDVLRAVKPSEQVVKIVHDGLVDMLGGDQPVGLNLNAAPPGRGDDGRSAGVGQDDHVGQTGRAPSQL